MTTWSDMNIYDRMKRMQEDMETAKDSIKGNLDEIQRFCRPDLISNTEDQGDTQPFGGSSLYEGTPAYAPRIMAKGFSGLMVGSNLDWLQYMPADHRFRGMDELKKLHQAQREHMLSVYRKSTFYKVLPGYTLDAITIGSPVCIVEEDEASGRIYTTIPHYSENYFDRNVFGQMEPYHRKWQWPLSKIEQKFGASNLSTACQTAIQNGKYREKFTLLMGIYSAKHRIFDGLKDKDFNKPNRPWIAIYIQTDTDDDKHKPLTVEGYWSKPYIGFDWEMLNGNEIWARTPAWCSIYDVKGGQNWWRGLSEVAQLEATPAWWVPRQFENRLHKRPGNVNYVDSTEMMTPPVPFTRGASNYPAGVDFAERHDRDVNRWYSVDMFTMLMTRQQNKMAPLTATEAAGLMGEQAVLMAPNIQAAEHVLEEFDIRFRMIERGAGRLPTPSEFGLDMPDMAEPQFIGLLSQAQKMSVGMRRIVNGLGIIQLMYSIWPEVKFKMRAGQMLERALEEMDFSQGDIVPEDEFQAILEAQSRQQADMQDIESMRQVAPTLKALSAPVDETSVLERISA